MKQLTDEVFAQVRDALASARVYMNHVAVANWQTPAVICSEALAALDTAQPVQVNAMLVEALEQVIKEPWVSGVRRIAKAALTAAKQAPPARPINCGTGHCSCIECPYEQAQPERAPLISCRCFDEVSKRLCMDKNKCVRIEAHGIKQGGQQ